MTELQFQSALRALQMAADSPFGFVFRANCLAEGDRQSITTRLKGVLYIVRQQVANPDFMRLQIKHSPDAPETDLWLIKMPEREPSTTPAPSTPARVVDW